MDMRHMQAKGGVLPTPVPTACKRTQEKPEVVTRPGPLPRMSATTGQMPARDTQGPSELQKASLPAGYYPLEKGQNREEVKNKSPESKGLT